MESSIRSEPDALFRCAPLRHCRGHWRHRFRRAPWGGLEGEGFLEYVRTCPGPLEPVALTVNPSGPAPQDALASSTYSAGNMIGSPENAAERALSAGAVGPVALCVWAVSQFSRSPVRERRSALRLLQRRSAALPAGSGYWSSAGAHEAGEVVTWSGRIPAARSIKGVEVSWVHGTDRVKLRGRWPP